MGFCEQYITASSLAILIAEYFQTLELEIRYIWPGPTNVVKAIFYINRYAIFFTIGVSMYFKNVADPSRCHAVFITACGECKKVTWPSLPVGYSEEDGTDTRRNPVLMMISVGTSQALLFIRVWALADRNKKMMIFLMAYMMVNTNCGLICYIFFFRSMEYALSPIPSIIGCIALRAEYKFMTACFALILSEQIVVMAVCLYLGIKRHWGAKSPLIRTFFVDGGIYFVAVAALALANMIVLTRTPNGGQLILGSLQGTLDSTLTTRMFLNLRRLAAKDPDVGVSALATREIELVQFRKTIAQTETTATITLYSTRDDV
ncbi:hypothetical protein CC1G_13819 [Coprinopsis cinerea okayama7|uniref:DUF6533 domain-containing protein n=1 Tax=Coprinopsis cinerea (strain Okayama-7 / 130 / ATCC MYA-4618 / FGSC 9003) TaxID=240176 RepID=D6RKE4_COPC7|nr:hypothetical protein CC1G_13819 [Coprinopsis cinerea okayama7\|eukprot:XP_002911784.1 hypothetical protein CC1G_13819 [Coprinopsis cinerea okayama7\